MAVEDDHAAEQAFIVERYWPDVDEAALLAALPRLEDAGRALSTEGRPVEHVGSFLVPADCVVFSVFRAGSPAVVREVNERAGLPLDRIAEVIWHGFGGDGEPAGAETMPMRRSSLARRGRMGRKEQA